MRLVRKKDALPFVPEGLASTAEPAANSDANLRNIDTFDLPTPVQCKYCGCWFLNEGCNKIGPDNCRNWIALQTKREKAGAKLQSKRRDRDLTYGTDADDECEGD